MHTPSSLEPLESRIAPAADFVTYTDLDGFVAQQIGSFKSFGFIAPLVLATTNQNIAIPFTNDVRILEVQPPTGGPGHPVARPSSHAIVQKIR